MKIKLVFKKMISTGNSFFFFPGNMSFILWYIISYSAAFNNFPYFLFFKTIFLKTFLFSFLIKFTF